ncbi:Dps family protein [Bacillus massilinigeriensis]|uniref:Dps family protein n=1 Tax=Bacillus massilionigeriensis TaxID=1805475 RepID=UPI00096B507F|nr:DNA starvation/stationary phase protection protein [Bacillus massilionigeriensis]
MDLQTSLNLQIANWTILYTKLHRFHWYVKGPLFFSLHAKFEELYEEAATVIDETAESLLAIGGQPIATLKEFLETATLTETNNEKTSKDMVASLVNDYQKIKEDLVVLADLAEKANNQVINDLAVGLIGKIETHVWMLNAYLGE